MARRRTPGTKGWTPRERVVLFFMIADNADWLPEADSLLAGLREVIAREECCAEQPPQPDPRWGPAEGDAWRHDC